MTRLFKALAILGMLLCFTLGAFALSFAAHDSPSRWPRLTVELNRVPANGDAQLTQYAFRFGLRSETGEVSHSSATGLGRNSFGLDRFRGANPRAACYSYPHAESLAADPRTRSVALIPASSLFPFDQD